MVGAGVDTVMVSTKALMDTISDVGDGTRGASGERKCTAAAPSLVG
jgi:hypothetical protein